MPTATKKKQYLDVTVQNTSSPLVISLLYDLCFRFNDFVTHDRDEKEDIFRGISRRASVKTSRGRNPNSDIDFDAMFQNAKTVIAPL